LLSSGGGHLISLAYLICRVLLRAVVAAIRRIDAKDIEILVLRHQLEVLHRQNGKPRFRPQDRLILTALSRLLPRHRWRCFVVRPETVLAWHRQLVTGKARRWGRKSSGRPPTPAKIRELVVRLARENPRWGYLRIRGELLKLGHNVPATTIRDILRRSGIGPAPRRDGLSWSEFLRRQASSILAADFFTVYTLWGRVVYVLFVIELSTRKVHLAGCTTNPNNAWVTQQARNFVMSVDVRVEPVRFLIHDRDAKFTALFDDVFHTEGVEILRTPIRSPRANAVAERWVKTVRTECLDWLLIAGRRHLNEVLRIYVEHYNRARPHRGLDLTIPDSPSTAANEPAPLSAIARRDRLGVSYTSMSVRHEQGDQVFRTQHRMRWGSIVLTASEGGVCYWGSPAGLYPERFVADPESSPRDPRHWCTGSESRHRDS
jgi:putative transposase